LIRQSLELRDPPPRIELAPDALVVPGLASGGQGKLELNAPDRRHQEILQWGREYPPTDGNRKPSGMGTRLVLY